MKEIDLTKSSIKEQIGKQFQNLRKGRNLTQDDIAKLIGKKSSQVGNWENSGKIRLADFEEVLTALGIGVRLELYDKAKKEEEFNESKIRIE